MLSLLVWILLTFNQGTRIVSPVFEKSSVKPVFLFQYDGEEHHD
jgi:hypothetical protein